MDAIRGPTFTLSIAMLFPNPGVQGEEMVFSTGYALLARLFRGNRRNGRIILSFWV
jgi:hypothetical protein